MDKQEQKELFEKKKIFRNFIILAFSFLILGIIYIHLVVLRTKNLLTLKNLENEKKKGLIKHSEARDKYIKKSDLSFIEKKARKELKMFYPEDIKYFKIK